MASNNPNHTPIDFIGIGAPKSASTWIGKCLEEHPDILFSSQKTRKEVLFFNTFEGAVWNNKKVGGMSYFDRGLDWYYDQFPDYEEGKIRGEFTVYYLADNDAYNRIHDTFPNVKLLATLRNPVDMVYSLHWYLYHGAVTHLSNDFGHNLDKGIFNDKGYYYKHLKKFYDLFPEENIKVVLTDDIKNDAQKTISEIYGFLGVDKDFVPPSLEVKVNAAFKPRSDFVKKVVNVSLNALDILHLDALRLKIFESQPLQDIYSFFNKTPTQYPPLTDELRQKGIDIFIDDITKLESLINRDLSSWKKV